MMESGGRRFVPSSEVQYDQISGSPETGHQNHTEGIAGRFSIVNFGFRYTENLKTKTATITTQPLVINRNLIQNLSIRHDTIYAPAGQEISDYLFSIVWFMTQVRTFFGPP